MKEWFDLVKSFMDSVKACGLAKLKHVPLKNQIYFVVGCFSKSDVFRVIHSSAHENKYL